MYFDPLYIIITLPALLLSVIASTLVKSTFKKYSQVGVSSGMTGAQAAAMMLAKSGTNDVKIGKSRGLLSDHYDPTSKTLRLSNDVYNSKSLSAIGVACHEAGHALQDAQGYKPLAWRSALVPVTQFGSSFSYFFILGGMLFQIAPLIKIGIVLFSAAVLFSIVTLPVEWDASRRAKLQMVECGIVTQKESEASGKVLNAAFLTYIAAAASALLTLLYYLIRSGLLGSRD
ncbi:MAG: zinc metallopeptidase [Lentisphaerae bacterium]|jgi:Zn-dependent membrane protease YugP|nr:zinc metallopeptidase [Lentisphaerota bacterium]